MWKLSVFLTPSTCSNVGWSSIKGTKVVKDEWKDEWKGFTGSVVGERKQETIGSTPCNYTLPQEDNYFTGVKQLVPKKIESTATLSWNVSPENLSHMAALSSKQETNKALDRGLMHGTNFPEHVRSTGQRDDSGRQGVSGPSCSTLDPRFSEVEGRGTEETDQLCSVWTQHIASGRCNESMIIGDYGDKWCWGVYLVQFGDNMGQYASFK
ncbi:hypothetical protein WN51_07923 [Melipona quadrifasciata]|uniref:Uncharacterized protein n=1 Tax=Melipona quadrifasciata TaxID=166423 RepID=A0A0N0BC94_9HYME|nr:hypothetical protein WN51_07923 [Melipona quadrifasciata]